ncbi:DUF6612 family protein [Virgibacillus kimchii]
MNTRLLFILASLAIMIAACNNTAESVDSSDVRESDLTVEEAFTKALEASEDLESTDAKINIKYEMSDAEDGTVIESTDSDINMQIIMEPFAMHLKESMNTELEGISGDIPTTDTEIYFVEDEMYIYNDYSGNDGNWEKMEVLSEYNIEEILQEYPDPNQQLAQIGEYLDDLSITKSEEAYILQLDADSERVNDLVHSLVRENLPEDALAPLGEEVQEALESMEVNNLILETTFDKEPFYMRTYNLELDMRMDIAGENNKIVQSMEAKYNNFNTIGSIEVPTDIEEEAIVQ